MNVAVWPASFWVTWITVLLCVVSTMMVGAMIVEWWQYTADKKAAQTYLLRVFIVIFWVVIFGLFFGLGRSHAHDHDHPEQDAWYRTLMQPDAPSVSCCGEADAYWADTMFVKDGKVFAVITDDRDDAPLGRPHVDIGTVVEVPNWKLKWDRGNPTGHAIVFMNQSLHVFCFVQGTGI